MIIRREALKACLVVTNEQETRFNLGAVQIQPDGRVVATDGHLLLIANDKEPFPEGDFPSKDLPEFKGSPTKPVLLPKAIALKLIAAMPKGATIPVLGAVRVGVNGQGTYAVATDLETPLVAKLDDQDARFPDWTKVMPSAKGTHVTAAKGTHVTVIFTGKMLGQLVKAAAAIGNERTGGFVKLEIPTKHEPDGLVMDAVRVELPGDEVEIVGAAMPCRV